MRRGPNTKAIQFPGGAGEGRGVSWGPRGTMEGRAPMSSPSRAKPALVAGPLLLLALAAAAWALLAGPDEAPPSAVSPGAPAAEAGDAAPASAPAQAALAGQRDADASDTPPEARPATDPQAAAPGASQGSRTTLDAPTPGTRAPLMLLVVDPDGQPVEGAEVALEGVRTADANRDYLLGSGSGSGLRARTDARGEASLRYPVTTHDGGVTSFVSFTVEHAEFVPYREPGLAVGSGRTTVTLGRSALLIVTGWIGAPENVVRDVEATLSFGTHVEPGSWRTLDDGRRAAIGVAPGLHAAVLTHVAEDGARYTSGFKVFDLFGGERKELALELVAARTIEGRLSFDVPRPVASGRVVVAQQVGRSRDVPRLFLRHEAAIEPDGTFRLEGLPPLAGEIVAACEGWVTTLLPTRDLERLGVTRPDPEVIAKAQERLGARALEPQKLDAEDDGPLVLETEPAGRLVVRVQAPDEEPVEGALVRVGARVGWSLGLSEPWPGTLVGTTDANGEAAFTTLPGGVHDVFVEHAEWVLEEQRRPNGKLDRVAGAVLESGTERTLVLRVERP